MKKVPIIITSLILISIGISGCMDLKRNDQKQDPNENGDNNILNTDEAEPDIVSSIDHKKTETNSDFNPVIIVNNDDIRTHTTYEFSIDDTPNNSNITWDFDDGIILYGRNVSHRYTVSDYYTIEVKITWESSSAESELSVDVRNADTVTGLVADINRIIVGYSGFGLGAEIQKGITIPESDVYLNLSQLTCDLSVTIGLFDNESNEIIILITDSIIGQKLTLNKYWHITGDMIEPFDEFRPMFLNLRINCDDYVGHAICEFTIILTY